MIEVEARQRVPLTLAEDGTIRLTGSRVTLDSVLDEFKRGATAEQIHDDFPSLPLRSIYGAISYYLEHTRAVEEYLGRQREAGEETRRFIEERQESAGLRNRVRARQSESVK